MDSLLPALTLKNTQQIVTIIMDNYTTQFLCKSYATGLFYVSKSYSKQTGKQFCAFTKAKKKKQTTKTTSQNVEAAYSLIKL